MVLLARYARCTRSVSIGKNLDLILLTPCWTCISDLQISIVSSILMWSLYWWLQFHLLTMHILPHFGHASTWIPQKLQTVGHWQVDLVLRTEAWWQDLRPLEPTVLQGVDLCDLFLHWRRMSRKSCSTVSPLSRYSCVFVVIEFQESRLLLNCRQILPLTLWGDPLRANEKLL